MVDIKDISGNILLSTEINGDSKRKFTLQKEDYITLKFSLDEPVYFKLGDGIDDEEIGLFELVDLYKPTKNEGNGGYDYELRLDAYYWKWKNKKFKYTPEHGGKEASWNLTASLDVHLGIFLRNLVVLGYTYRGTAFEFAIDSTVENSAKLVSYDNTNMIDALTAMAEAWECEWWVTDNIIHFGRCEFGDPVDFETDVNVKSMSRSDSQTNYATRIIAFGSTKNIPTNYRPVDEQIVVNGVVQRRLMLPEGTPYVDAYENMSEEEAVEDIVVFDDIYPKFVGTIAEITQTTGNYVDENNNPTGETYPVYTFKDTSLKNFKKDYLLDELRLIFQSGSLNGLDFALTLKSSDDTGTTFEIVRNDDYGRDLPDDTLKPIVVDTYALYGFNTSFISDEMLPVAEKELKERTQAYVEKKKIDPSTYDCKMSPDYMYNNGTPRTFAAGDKVNLINKGYFKDGRVSRIIGIECYLDKPYDSPVYTVGETAAYSRISDIEDKVDAVTYKGQTYTGSGGSGVYVIRTNDSTQPSDSNVFSAKRTKAEIDLNNKSLEDKYIRKDQDDSTPHNLGVGSLTVGDDKAGIDKDGNLTTLNALIRVLADTYNLNVSNVATLFRTTVKDYVSSETFIPGFAGEGFKLYKALSGDWNLEVDNATIRKGMTIFELIISKIRAINGGLVVSQGNGRVKSVAETTGTPVYYVLGIEGDMTFKVDDFVRCQVFSSTGAKYYWVRVDSISSDSIVIPKSEFSDGTVPTVGDDLVQMGNKTDKSRQGLLYLTASEDGKPRFSVLDGVDSTDLTGKNKLILGCLDGITDSDFPDDAQPSGYGLWAANVFLKGLFILRNGKSVEDELNDQITAVKTAFEIREGQISTKVQAATTAAAQAAGSASAAANSANQASGILASVTQKETNINQTANAIELKATRAESAAGRAESAEASINVKADGIVMQAASSAAQTAVDGIQIGGRNLLSNSEIAVTSSFPSDADNYDYYTDKTCYLEAGVQYIVSGVCPSGLTWTSQHGAISSTNAVLWLRGGNGDHYIISSFSTGTTGSTFTVPTSQTYTLRTNVYKSGQYTFSKIQIERGNKKTDWGLSKADSDTQLALRPTTEYLKSQFTIAPGGISLMGKTLSLAGMVTFSSLDSSAQSTINAKATKAEAQDYANAALNSAKSYSDTLKNSLGSLAYQNAVTLAKLDSTIVQGGYIKTSLIDANSVITNSLLASKIAATDITTSRLTVTTGARIAGFKVSGAGLTNANDNGTFTNDAYVIFRNDTHKCFAGIGGDVLPASSGARAVARFENEDTTNQWGLGANYAMILSAKNAAENYALMISNGYIGGFSVKVRQISSTTTLYHYDCFVSCYNTGTISVYLPSGPQIGKMIYVMRVNHAQVNVYGNGRSIRNGGSSVSSIPINNDGEIDFFLFDGQYWMYSYFNQ